MAPHEVPAKRAMARYSGKNRISDSTREEGMRIAQSTQRPGQTKEQTKLIAQGIQRGIDLYKKQHKARARELDRKLRRADHRGGADARNAPVSDQTAPGPEPDLPRRQALLPWALLAATWLAIGMYFLWPALRALLGR